ncbi:ALK and LTK ligand 2 Protein FAM150B Precursor [Channa argus]|uniref:ALK and LTK ligand 2 Protein FAM150B n=1 Tax=Channa argus TaxID=215402 RepID=A0A6G1QKM8_CHAAH|nr:ALK and LTK ligand 2 Protein FAM150B Precursor [Channa argus]
MRELRKHFTMGLVLLMCALIGHSSESAPSAAPETPLTCRGVQRYLRRVVEIVKHVEESRGRHSARTEAPFTMRARTSLVEPKDLRHLKIKNKGKESVVVIPRDVKKKEPFIKHITGPLYFSPKCRKHVYRLYHHTRDCTIPACVDYCHYQLSRR